MKVYSRNELFVSIFAVFFARGSFEFLEGFFVLPNAAGVIFGAGDDGVALVVEGAAEDLIVVTFQLL